MLNYHRWFVISVAWWLAALAADARGADALVVPLRGAAFDGALESLNQDGGFAFRSMGKTRVVPVAALVRFGSPAELETGPVVVTVDRGWFVADVSLQPVILKEDKLIFDTRFLDQVSVPLRQVAGVVLRRPKRTLEAELLLDKTSGAEARADQVLLENGDRLEGNVTALSAEKLMLDVAGRSVSLEARSVSAILFNPLLSKPVKTAHGVMVGLSDGSRIPMTRQTEKSPLVSLLGEGLRVPVSKVVWLQPQGEGAVYLSDLEPAGYRHTPFLDLPWPYHRDRNVLGGQLRAGRAVHAKGIGMHSTSVLSYALSKPYRTLDAEVAIDDETAGKGSVVFRVYVDTGDGKWQKRYESPVVRGGAKPLPISVDLAGAKRVSLLVDYADHGDELDHADWLDARLVE